MSIEHIDGHRWVTIPGSVQIAGSEITVLARHLALNHAETRETLDRARKAIPRLRVLLTAMEEELNG